MSKSNYIKLTLIPLALVLGLGFLYLKVDFKNSVTGKVSAVLLNKSNEIQSNSENQTIDHESAAPIYFSIFKFITNLAPKN